MKELLYFDGISRSREVYMGYPVFEFIFRNVKTGEIVTLKECILSSNISDNNEKYYTRIEDAMKDYDIIWNISDMEIRISQSPFEEVKSEYDRLVQSNEDIGDLGAYMMSTFNKSGRTM